MMASDAFKLKHGLLSYFHVMACLISILTWVCVESAFCYVVDKHNAFWDYKRIQKKVSFFIKCSLLSLRAVQTERNSI